jgi:hypothetical protein
MRVGGRRESILVWDGEDNDFNVDEESERVPRERCGTNGSYLAVAGSTSSISRLRNLRSSAQYLDTVDEVLFGGRKGDLRGWASEQERRGKGRLEVRHYLTRVGFGYVSHRGT